MGAWTWRRAWAGAAGPAGSGMRRGRSTVGRGRVMVVIVVSLPGLLAWPRRVQVGHPARPARAGDLGGGAGERGLGDNSCCMLRAKPSGKERVFEFPYGCRLAEGAGRPGSWC